MNKKEILIRENKAESCLAAIMEYFLLHSVQSVNFRYMILSSLAWPFMMYTKELQPFCCELSWIINALSHIVGPGCYT